MSKSRFCISRKKDPGLKMSGEINSSIDAAKEVSFVLHGEVHTIKASSDITPETSLNTYLRNHANLRGTKVMCQEGGCGVCVVAVTVKHPVTKKERTFSVNSCLIPILSCHGWFINTIEAIGSKQKDYHPIQKTLAKFNGTQCGFCSGGMIMNMYGLYESNDKLTMKDVENSFGGSLCRCTGYRPILDAFKSLTKDADPSLLNKYPDIEDIKLCKKTGMPCADACKLKPIEEKRILMKFDNYEHWYKVYSINDILELFQEMGDSVYRFVAGNTGKGVFKIENNPEYWIDVTSVPELISHKVDKNLVLGANVSLTDTMAIILKLAEENPDFSHLKKVQQHLDLVANVPVRNGGTIAGNLSMKHDHHDFPSDVFLLLECIKAELTIVQKGGSEVTKSVLDYLTFDMNKCVLKSVTIPPLSKDKYVFESYKICPRVQNAHAYVNAAFLVEHDKFVVKSARILFGGINPNFVHATETEKFLVGKNLTDNATLQTCMKKLDEEVKPDEVLTDAAPKFRKDLAKALFYKFVLATVPQDKVNPKFASGGTRIVRGLSSGEQIYQTTEKNWPVTKPVPKLEAMIQCSGEAIYVNDIPPFPRELHGAFVLGEVKPLSKIKNIDAADAKAMPGVRGFITYKDIPGVNAFTAPVISPTVEQLFAEDKVLYNGQPIGLILADTFDQAQKAAAMVKVDFEASNEVPVYNAHDALKYKRDDLISNVVKVDPKRRGDNVKHVIKGQFELGSQYHFTMETQSCVSVPNDEGGVDMFPASQWMDHVQHSAARALKIPMNKVNVEVKRLGGAYGAKIVRSSMVSTASAIAAFVMNKPVRIQLPLVHNMKALGKRTPTWSEYEVGVDDNGVIQYLDNTFYQPYGLSGHNEAVTTHVMHFIASSYEDDTWKMYGNMVQTDMPGNAACRAPGSTEGIGMTETMMEHISYVLKKDPLEVRKANIKAGNEMPDMIKDTIIWSDYEKRKKAVEEFNSKNRWMKKGLSFVVMEYQLTFFGPYSVFVAVYAGDGTVAISHGGIESGQGINTKVAQVCAYTFKIPLEMVQVKASSSLISANNIVTGGSITSEAVCYATIQACNEILRRLEPLREQKKDATWQELTMMAFGANIEMVATHMFGANSDWQNYPIMGTCVTEVTCDILTGEHNIDRVDLQEDAGQSLSPEIDVGQMEGAFVMGLGYYTCENLIYDDKGGLATNNTWTYKVPGAKDIPEKFRIKFKQDSSNPKGVLNSKATGEPPLCMSVSVPLAIRRALASARGEADPSADPFVPIKGPTTVEFKFQNSLNDHTKYTL